MKKLLAILILSVILLATSCSTMTDSNQLKNVKGVDIFQIPTDARLMVRSTSSGHSDYVEGFVISPDNRYAVSGGRQ